MPTIPEAPRPDAPHRHREIAETFGEQAERYDRTRPDYPAELAETVLGGLPGRRVLDVGIGSGLSALPFAAAGADVLGVEPDERMAAVARRRGFDVEIGRFEEWDAAGRRFDAVVAGQTWHWIDPDAGAAKAAEVLVPGGRIALFWNIPQPDPAIADAFAAVYRRVDTGLPFQPWAAGATAYDPITGEIADAVRRTGAFEEPERRRFDWMREYRTEEWLDVVPTSGGHNRIPPERLEELLEGLGDAVDALGGRFTMGYATVALLAERRTD